MLCSPAERVCCQKKTQPVPYISYFICFFFFFFFFLREKLKATDAIKGVAHYSLELFFFFLNSRKSFCKNEHVNKKPPWLQRLLRYFLGDLSLAGRWQWAAGSSAAPPWGYTTKHSFCPQHVTDSAGSKCAVSAAARALRDAVRDLAAIFPTEALAPPHRPPSLWLLLSLVR